MSSPSLPRIQALPLQLANQIAAGEVVERPASVLKELLENSLDAGADRIDVEVEQGGIALIRVRDNGVGIHHADLSLALSPHATSKIRSQDDLEQVMSLGFRGEALASIASVSRLTLASGARDSGQAWQISTDCEATLTAHPVGTTVEMRDLFYNTPARRKFLRSPTTEFFHVEQVFRRLALSRFEVALSLQHNRRPVLRLRGVEAGDPGRIADVLGKSFAREVLSLTFAADGLRIWGWIAPPAAARPQADVQFFYVNGRLIRDRLISHALRQAHREQLPDGRHPAYVLYLEIAPGEVDVNVHPTKHEVRFREARRVHDFLHRAVREALEPSLVATPAVVPPAAAVERSPVAPNVPYPRSPLRPQPKLIREQLEGYRGLAAPPPAPRSRPAQRSGERVATVLLGRYAIVERTEGALLFDAATAQEAITLARLKERFSTDGIGARPLLVPEVTESGVAETNLEEAIVAAARYGFELTPAGESTVMVRKVPTLLSHGRAAPLARYLLPAVVEPGLAPERVLAGLARSARDNPAERLDVAGAEALIQALHAESFRLEPFSRALTAEFLEGLFETNSTLGHSNG